MRFGQRLARSLLKVWAVKILLSYLALFVLLLFTESNKLFQTIFTTKYGMKIL